jgi:shikimate dehydrogenase
MTREGRRAAVLGSPIDHSLSPALHRAAYAALGLTGWSYEAIECNEARLAGLIDSMGSEWAGLSLTMPLKRAVLPLLDRVTPLAGQVGGANTVVFGDGGRVGYNTDVPGMIDALTAAGLTAAGPVVILGAGATASAALAALRDVGAREATVAARDPRRGGDVLAAADRLGMAVRLTALGDQRPAPDGLLISALPPGAADFYAERIRCADRPPRAVFDVVYDPWPTRLAEAAAAAGIPVIGGFELLLHQAARQVELMTGLAAPVSAMRQAGLAELRSRRWAVAGG